MVEAATVEVAAPVDPAAVLLPAAVVPPTVVPPSVLDPAAVDAADVADTDPAEVVAAADVLPADVADKVVLPPININLSTFKSHAGTKLFDHLNNGGNVSQNCTGCPKKNALSELCGICVRTKFFGYFGYFEQASLQTPF